MEDDAVPCLSACVREPEEAAAEVQEFIGGSGDTDHCFRHCSSLLSTEQRLGWPSDV